MDSDNDSRGDRAWKERGWVGGVWDLGTKTGGLGFGFGTVFECAFVFAFGCLGGFVIVIVVAVGGLVLVLGISPSSFSVDRRGGEWDWGFLSNLSERGGGGGSGADSGVFRA